MSLESKLQGLQREIGLTESQSRPESDGARINITPRHRLEDRLAGTVINTDAGSCFVAETNWAAHDPHGGQLFSGLSRVSSAGLAMITKDSELAYADLSHAVFLDTETTGLGLGAGTYVFLVGAGYLDGDVFRVKQFFLRGPGNEVAFLTALADFLESFSALVTFNGKAFDLPLLENRFVRHRRRLPFGDPPHVDLLHPARRLWKRRLASCALSSLESEILGVRRTQQDVPGWEIPARYFRYQRTGDSRELEGVFYHNLHDILSLAALTIHVDQVLADPFAGHVTHPVDFFSLGRAYERAGDADRSAMCFEEGLRRGIEGPDRTECLIRLSAVQKRERRWEAALQTWEWLLEEGGEAVLYARVELAKYYEHVERDYLTALDHVQQALAIAQLFDSPWPDASERDLNHRLSRLLNRSIQHRGWSAARV
ncbi:MAG TPA: ribonuclease H-like domain-containing protein [Chloroflexota bacterium]